MTREQAEMLNMINAFDFAIHEIALFLDSHPDNTKALELLGDYRNKMNEAIENYEAEFGDLITTHEDTPINGRWKWIDSPWPWEYVPMEGR